MNEGTYAPPFYTDLYNFRDGSLDDIFEGFYASIPTPGPNLGWNPASGSGGGGGFVVR